jgi:SEC-C motif domain protein
MRSRYTAYTQGNADYVSATWHATTRPATLMLAMPDTPHATKWLGLSVHTFEVIDEAHAQVRFTARYRDGGKAFRMTELSDFVREDGQWFYVEGVVETSA